MPHRLPTMADQWAEFMRYVMDGQAPETQRIEMRRAFYAGAHVIMQIHQAWPADISDEEGAAQLERIAVELTEFARAVSDGRA